MPKIPIDYSNTIIYKIEHIEDETLVYVGHTTNFDKRKCQHKTKCNNIKEKNHNLKVYKMIRENGGWDSFKMLEIEKYPCNDRREAEKRENDTMKELKSSMNTRNSFLSEEDKKGYYLRNIEMIKEKRKEYRERNKEKSKEYRERNKEYYKKYNKEYREQNRDKAKEYREQNKEYFKKTQGK